MRHNKVNKIYMSPNKVPQYIPDRRYYKEHVNP